MAIKKADLKKDILITLMTLLAIIFLQAFLNQENVMAVDKSIVISVDAQTLGQGYIVKPSKVKFDNNDTGADVLLKVLKQNKIKNEYLGSPKMGFYLQGLKSVDTGKINIPKSISNMKPYQTGENSYIYPPNNKSKNDFYPDLYEFSYGKMSGWMYCVNGEYLGYSLSDYIPKDNDVLEVRFTCFGYGADLGAMEGDDNNLNIVRKCRLVGIVGKINENTKKYFNIDGVREIYNEAQVVLDNFEAGQEEIDAIYKKLYELIMEKDSIDKEIETDSSDSNSNEIHDEKDTESKKNTNDIKSQTKSVNNVLKKTQGYILKTDKNLSYNSQWLVIGLSRNGYDKESKYFKKYYENIVTYLEENNGDITKAKYSEYSKLIISLTALGKDARNINGYNLLSYLSDFENVKKQGINGPIWALIALNTNSKYEIPKNKEAKINTTEEVLIKYILDNELEGGGWALSGTNPDVDITAMAIQALSKYYNDKDYSDVTKAINRGVKWLGKAQNKKTGGFSCMGYENSESCAQVVVALCSIGINPDEDARFIKSGKSPVDNLLTYALKEGGFSHIKGTDVNMMATEQGFYALVAYSRLLKGQTFIYDMSDLNIEKPKKISVDLTANKKSVSSNEKEIVNGSYNKTNISDDSNEKEVKSDKKSDKRNSLDSNEKINISSKPNEEGWEFEGKEYNLKNPGEDNRIVQQKNKSIEPTPKLLAGIGSMIIVFAAASFIGKRKRVGR